MEKIEIKELVELYFEMIENSLDNPSQSAPSGEWEEYNVHHLISESELHTTQRILKILGFTFSEEEIGEEEGIRHQIIYNGEIVGEFEEFFDDNKYDDLED